MTVCSCSKFVNGDIGGYFSWPGILHIESDQGRILILNYTKRHIGNSR